MADEWELERARKERDEVEAERDAARAEVEALKKPTGMNYVNKLRAAEDKLAEVEAAGQKWLDDYRALRAAVEAAMDRSGKGTHEEAYYVLLDDLSSILEKGKVNA